MESWTVKQHPFQGSYVPVFHCCSAVYKGMPDRTLIISDVHLACPRTWVKRAELLRPLWENVHRVVINGDVAELCDPKRRTEAARQTLLLQSLCKRDGVDLTLLAGNHDAFLTDRRCLMLAGERVLVTHGDLFLPALTRPSSNGAPGGLPSAGDGKVSGWSEPPAPPHPFGLRAAMYLRALRPTTLYQMARYCLNMPGMASQFLQVHAPSARFLVFGHTHRAGIWEIGSRVIVNTGSFGSPSRPRGVLIDQQTLSVFAIVQKDGSFHLGGQPLASFSL